MTVNWDEAWGNWGDTPPQQGPADWGLPPGPPPNAYQASYDNHVGQGLMGVHDDPGFHVPTQVPTDPNYMLAGNEDWWKYVGPQASKYSSFWGQGPPNPPSPEMNLWDIISQGIWNGTLEGQGEPALPPEGGGYPIPPPQYPPRPEMSDEPYMKNWDYMMGNTLWDNVIKPPPPELPTLPKGASW